MKPASKTPPPTGPERAADKSRGADKALQPPATGATRGSPAAPVMKQFQKTKAESSGRS